MTININLQWSRDLSVAETRPLSRAWSVAGLSLQWSRDLSVAETRADLHPPAVLSRPSMEPRPFSRGNSSYGQGSRTVPAAFNGAATFQSRKPPVLAGRFTSMRTFNGAATFQSRKPIESSLFPHTSPAFNGAATFQSRKRGCEPPDCVDMVPSMEPRPFSRGNCHIPRGPRQEVGPSMEPRPFSRGNHHAWDLDGLRSFHAFNGAATFQSRKQPNCHDYGQDTLER